MLQVILEGNEVGIPKRFEAAFIAFVCISFVLSHFQLQENRISGNSIYKYTAIIRIILQLLLGNFAVIVPSFGSVLYVQERYVNFHLQKWFLDQSWDFGDFSVL